MSFKGLLLLSAFICAVLAHTHEEVGGIAGSLAVYGRKLVYSGGYDGYELYNTQYVFDVDGGVYWTYEPEEFTPMISPRFLHSSVVFKDFIFHFGNEEGLEIVGLANGEQTNQNLDFQPSQNVGHSSILYDNQMFVFGGESTSGPFSELWIANLEGPVVTWEFRQTPVPARAYHSAVLYQGVMYIFGGITATGEISDEVWKYSIEEQRWLRSWSAADILPPARAGHSATYWADEKMYIFGGLGNSGFSDDMWSFDFRTEEWEFVQQGMIKPSPRALHAHAVIDNTWYSFAGQVGLEGDLENYWSPQTGFLDIFNADDFSGEVWAFDFGEMAWNYEGCFPVFPDKHHNGSKSIPAEECRSQHRPSCLNDCSGNGVCYRDNECLCRGQWRGEDCSFNVCDLDLHRGYDVELMDRVLISESILKLGKELSYLKETLQYVQDKLPPYEEYISCIRAGEQSLGQLYVVSASVEGVHYHDCITESLLPILSDLNLVLEESNVGPVRFK